MERKHFSGGLGVVGSNPATPTTFINRNKNLVDGKTSCF
jgi:hypothetical protein